MTWVRNPWWDGFWILSGLPIGLVLMMFAPGMVPPLAIAIMVLETAHVVSPMVLACIRPELREIMRRKPLKCIMAPAGIIVASFFVPFEWAWWPYWIWNIWHFGMQNFGVTSLYWREHRALRKWGCLGVTAGGMGMLPLLHNPRLDMLCMGVFSFNHWLTDIGLSSRVARWQWSFIAGILGVGVLWLVLRNGPLSVLLVPQVMVFRYGVGMVHFILESEFWKLGDPQVRNTIGRDLFVK